MSFLQFLTILRARMRLILLTVLATLVAAVAATILLPKRYDATASVVVEPKSTDLVSDTRSNSASQMTADRVDNLISTHSDILSSPNVALRVVEALKLESNPRAKELLTGGGPLGVVRAWIAGVQEWVMSLLPGAEERRPMSLKDWMADRLLHNMKLNSSRDSRLIKVTYSSPDSDFSAAAANAFVKAYRATLLEMQVDPARQSSKWYDEQIKDLKYKLEQAEAKLAKFQQGKGIVATDERMDIENARMADLSTQLGIAQSQAYESEARQRQLREFLSRGGGNMPAEVAASPVVQQLKQAVSDRESKLAQMSRQIGPNHPVYRAAVSELEGLKSQLKEQMRSAAQNLMTSGDVATQRESQLHGALEAQRNRVLKLKTDRNELAMLVREVDSAQRTYNAAVERYTENKMQSEVEQVNGSIVDSATPPNKPAFPNATLNLALGLFMGSMLGVGLALFFESVRRYVRTEQDLVEFLGVPVLAVLAPKVGGRHNVRYLKGPATLSLPRM